MPIYAMLVFFFCGRSSSCLWPRPLKEDIVGDGKSPKGILGDLRLFYQRKSTFPTCSKEKAINMCKTFVPNTKFQNGRKRRLPTRLFLKHFDHPVRFFLSLCAMARPKVMKNAKSKKFTTCMKAAEKKCMKCMKAGKVQGNKLGQAEALHGPLWNQWRQHVLKTGPTWLFVVISLAHMLCCRVTEILKLTGDDFSFRHRFVRIKPLKRQPEAGEKKQ